MAWFPWQQNEFNFCLMSNKVRKATVACIIRKELPFIVAPSDISVRLFHMANVLFAISRVCFYHHLSIRQVKYKFNEKHLPD